MLNNLGYDIRKAEKIQRVKDFTSKNSIDKKIIDTIFNFYDKIIPFYDVNTPKQLQIAGMWRGILEKGRKKQLNYISEKNKKDYYELQEKMFYNELVDGLWNYNFYKPNMICSSQFLEECKIFEKITGKKIDELATNNSWSCWGLATSNGIIKYIDPSHGITAFHILTLLNNIKTTKIPVILDLGSGYGGLAEKIMIWSNNSVNMCLIDIPLNLTTAYAYLTHIFGTERIILISSKDELTDMNIKNSSGKFILIPTILIPYLPNFEFDIVNNTHSFSEMDLHTIKYYLERFVTSKVSYLIETNVNIPKHVFAGHLEIMSSEFPIPSSHKLLSRFSDGVQTRYVTSIYVNST